MRYCIRCGKELIEGAAFCAGCGAPVQNKPPIVPVQNELPIAPAQPKAYGDEIVSEARAFLADTHKLLRWEMKAWSIASTVWTIVGVVYAAIFSFFMLIGMALSMGGIFFTGFGAFGVLFFGGSFIGLGIVSRKAADKLPQYINTVYTDFSIAYKRCGNIGMLVFCAILGVVAPIFFIINFVRMKANRNVIEFIIQTQNAQG